MESFPRRGAAGSRQQGAGGQFAAGSLGSAGSECAVFLAVSALTGNILVRTIPILVFRALTRQNWFDMVLGIPVETQLGIFCRKTIRYLIPEFPMS